jgi:hypothetical protein
MGIKPMRNKVFTIVQSAYRIIAATPPPKNPESEQDVIWNTGKAGSDHLILIPNERGS